MASDRIQKSENGGIVAFVTNGGFIDSNAFDGFRKAVAEEFHAVYCFNLRGDQRTAGEKSRQEGGKVFGQESRAGVAILLLVKKPGESPGATIYYRDIGDYLGADAKLEILADSRLSTTKWQTITPNEYGDWVGQRSDTFQTLLHVASMFTTQTQGLVTRRDAWCSHSSALKLKKNIHNTVSFYNSQVEAFRNATHTVDSENKSPSAEGFVKHDPKQFHWNVETYRDARNGVQYGVDNTGFVEGSYRPFFKQALYFDQYLNSRIGKLLEIYPTPQAQNLGISITGLGSNSPFHTLMTDNIPEYCLTAVNSLYLPRYRYIPAQALTVRRARTTPNWSGSATSTRRPWPSSGNTTAPRTYQRMTCSTTPTGCCTRGSGGRNSPMT